MTQPILDMLDQDQCERLYDALETFIGDVHDIIPAGLEDALPGFVDLCEIREALFEYVETE